ncbi:hypothetical protein [Helicobacter sp. 23-1045]
MRNEIEKLKYHISTIKDSVEFINIDGLAVKMDLSKEQFDRLLEICDEFERRIENEKFFSKAEFEMTLENEFGIGYQTIKMIVDDFAKYGHFDYLIYVYMLTSLSNVPFVKAKYKKLDEATKNFIDEVVKNSRKTTNGQK